MSKPGKKIFLLLVISMFLIAVPALVAVGVAYMLTDMGIVDDRWFWATAAAAFALQQMAIIADCAWD